MGFTCGIVGLPNVGKSTLFNALTAAGAEVANYPFCTIDPNRGVSIVADPRLDKLARITKPQKITPTILEFWDIAGLVAGAHRGEGLGNQFLSHIRNVDAIAHVVRVFEDDNVSHVFAEIDPLRDVEIIDTELCLADLEQVERRIEKVGKMAKVGDKPSKALLPVLEQLRDSLQQGKSVRSLALGDDEQKELRDLNLLTAKPVLYVANLDEPSAESSTNLSALEEFAHEQGCEFTTICASLEAEIGQLDDPEEQQLFYEEMGLQETGLNRLVRTGYELLGLITFYTTVGPELRAWTIPGRTPAQKAAGRIHTDFERGFICAEVIHWDDFDRLESEQLVRERGLMHVEGRDYRVQDGDIIQFKWNL